MKCLSCNTLLTDFEATRKYTTGAYVDLCNNCFTNDRPVIERLDLLNEEDIDQEIFNLDDLEDML